MKLLTLLATGLAFFATTRAHAQDPNFGMYVNVDFYDDVVGAPVQLEQLGQVWNLITDAEGNTTNIIADIDEPMVVTINEALTTTGESTVGQRYVYDRMLHSRSPLGMLHLTAAVPAFRPLSVTNQGGSRVYSDDHSGRWLAETLDSPGSELSEIPQVATLVGNAQVNAYIDYHDDLVIPRTLHGFVIRTQSDVVLPPEGLLFHVFVREDYASLGVHSRYFGQSANPSTFTTSIVVGEVMPVNVDSEAFVLRLDGTLRAGDNAFFLQTNRFQSGAVASASTSTPPAASGGGSTSSATSATTCPEIEPYDVPGDCTPGAPGTPAGACGSSATLVSTSAAKSRCTAVSIPKCDSNPNGGGGSVTTGAGAIGTTKLFFEWLSFGGTVYNEFSSPVAACQCTKNFVCFGRNRSVWNVEVKIAELLNWNGEIVATSCKTIQQATYCTSLDLTASHGVCDIANCGEE